MIDQLFVRVCAKAAQVQGLFGLYFELFFYIYLNVYFRLTQRYRLRGILLEIVIFLKEPPFAYCPKSS